MAEQQSSTLLLTSVFSFQFIQVEGKPLSETLQKLWAEEGVWMATKGLSARLVQSVAFSFFIMLGYETIKRWSLLEDYKRKVRW